MLNSNICDLNKHANFFANAVVENLELMGGITYEKQESIGDEKSADVVSGITFYIYFTGTAQGTYMLNMSEETAMKLSDCESTEDILYEGFLDEVLNTSVGQAIEVMKKYYGFLTFNPPVINWGVARFPSFEDRRVSLSGDCGDINCHFSISKIGMDVTDKLLKTMKDLRQKVKEGNKDSLTGLNNRKFFDEYVTAFNNTKDRVLSFAMIDLDDFKHINDGHGHDIGDKALRYVAESIMRATRDSDLPVRFGGDEFVLILENTPSDGAGVVLRRIAKWLIHNPLTLEDGTKICITLSCGVTQLVPEESFETLFKRADTNLYKSKEEGKNCVVVDGIKLV